MDWGYLRKMSDIIEKMLDQGLLDDHLVNRIRNSVADGNPLEHALLEGSGLSEEQILRFLANEFQYPFLVLDEYNPSKGFLAQFPARIMLEQQILPIEGEDGSMLVATSRLFDTSGVDELRLATGKDFQLALAPAPEIDRTIKRCLGVGADTVQSMVSEVGENGLQIIDQDLEGDMDLTEAAEGASIIRFVNQVLTEAIELRATDVHIEPFEDELQVRYRIDGVLKDVPIPPGVRRFQAAIISRLKILSQLDIAEKRLPQDGRIRIRINNREVDVRVSVIPMLHGEAIVLRLLDRSSVLLGLEQLGMSRDDQNIFSKLLEIPYGIILVTGPTGSGKTTSLYSAINHINSIEKNIVTIEDPVEYQLDIVNQNPVKEKIGLTFAKMLKHVLRQDPDVVMVGEIRERETAEIAVQAALTGHLVLSTLHTNDSIGAVTRMLDMGIEPYLLSSALIGVVAQRLVRSICPKCKTEYLASSEMIERFHWQDKGKIKLSKGRGCNECYDSGYRGRLGIHEIIETDSDMQKLIISNPSRDQLTAYLDNKQIRLLFNDGLDRVLEGKTTIEEIARTINS